MTNILNDYFRGPTTDERDVARVSGFSLDGKPAEDRQAWLRA